MYKEQKGRENIILYFGYLFAALELIFAVFYVFTVAIKGNLVRPDYRSLYYISSALEGKTFFPVVDDYMGILYALVIKTIRIEPLVILFQILVLGVCIDFFGRSYAFSLNKRIMFMTLIMANPFVLHMELTLFRTVLSLGYCYFLFLL